MALQQPLEGYEGQRLKRLVNVPSVKQLQKAAEKGEIIQARVAMVETIEGTPCLVLDVYGYKGIVPNQEVDADREWTSLVGFLGRTVFVKIKGFDPEAKILACSRKEAQQELRRETLAKLHVGLQLQGLVKGFTDYGAFVEIGGIISFMRNKHFSSDGTPAREVLEKDNLITVKIIDIKEVDDKKRIFVELVPRYKAPSIRNWDNFKPGQVVEGKVNGITANEMFVNIAPNLDALCEIPPGLPELQMGSRVAFKINQVKPELNRVRGKIVRVL